MSDDFETRYATAMVERAEQDWPRHRREAKRQIQEMAQPDQPAPRQRMVPRRRWFCRGCSAWVTEFEARRIERIITDTLRPFERTRQPLSVSVADGRVLARLGDLILLDEALRPAATASESARRTLAPHADRLVDLAGFLQTLGRGGRTTYLGASLVSVLGARLGVSRD